MTTDNFYHDFEASFRGTREEISGRLRDAYAPFLACVAQAFPEPKALDLGCGRGEWLELAQSLGIAAKGVDLDDGMLADCFALGLDVSKADAIEYLRTSPTDSLAVVSGFHIAEHLPFDALRSLIREALRALRPGGLLILETPNAENISVGTLWFHMDPTHNRPLPPGFLSFLGRNAGFARVDVLRLQEDTSLKLGDSVQLIDVFRGVSPDYAIVAQKAAPKEVMDLFDPAFGRAGGLTLETLSERFEWTVERKISQTITHEVDRRLADMRSEQHALIQDYQARLLALQSSTSWKVTKPLRKAGEVIRILRPRAVGFVRHVGLSALKSPGLRQIIKKTVGRFPRLEALGRRVLLGSDAPTNAPASMRQALAQQHLSPRAQIIHERMGRQKVDRRD
jgi:SAM-dependent methyltransferase